MTEFSKNEHCPSSFDLNAFQLGETTVDEGREIRLHIRTCEFCAAESEFYARFPQPYGPPEEPQAVRPSMPRPLKELAETMLNRNRGAFALESLVTIDHSD
jgi:hypothetical protein